jgi:hypothetical protein
MRLVSEYPLNAPMSALRKLAVHFGGQPRIVCPSEFAPAADGSKEPFVAIIDLCPDRVPNELMSVLSSLATADQESYVLFPLTRAHPETCATLLQTTWGSISTVLSSPTGDATGFPLPGRAFSKALASHQYKRAGKPSLSLKLTLDHSCDVIMTVEDNPTFVHIAKGNLHLFIWATAAIFDITRPLTAEIEFEQSVDEYLPAIIFLRSALRERAWHNPDVRAGLTIDDPLLSARYGFIDFRRLLDSAHRHRYHVTLAYIPWNYWRNSRRNAKIFRDRSSVFSVCAHGCDHTNHEFGSGDHHELLAKNHVAAERMTKLSHRTGLKHERLFVCPQERCSLAAWQAFVRAGRFLAMVNTGCMPRDLSQASLCGADLLAPAQDCFFGFPVFKRYYWGDMANFALSIFLGKPAILVEHHEFFNDSLSRIESFATDLRSIDDRVEWLPLESTVIQTHLRRTVSASETAVQFFTKEFEFQHPNSLPHVYRLRKRIGDQPLINVLVNGATTSYTLEDGYVEVEFQVGYAGTYRLKLEFELQQASNHPFGVRYHAGVATRRFLSEFRDNVVARNRKALKFSRFMMSTFRLTGESKSKSAQRARLQAAPSNPSE